MYKGKNIQYYFNWFDQYLTRFAIGGKYPENIQMKIDHSIRVYEGIVDIARSLKLHEHDIFLAKLMGLFHDIGRFKQYAKYKTFSDSKSEDHAKLGLEVIAENKLFDTLETGDKKLIIDAIHFHNKRGLPDAPPRETMFYKLLRDADKLDIYKVVTDKFSKDNKNKTLTLDLPDKLLLSPENFKDIMAQRIVDIKNLNTRYDFLFLMISWVYDINYHKTLELITERKYLDKLFDHLYEIEETATIKPFIINYTQRFLHQHTA